MPAPHTADEHTDATEALWNALSSRDTTALVHQLRERLAHEHRDEPRPRYASYEDQMADEAGVPARGEI